MSAGAEMDTAIPWGGKENLERAKFGMAKFVTVKNWHEFLDPMAPFGTKFPDCGIRTSIHRMCWLLAIVCWKLLESCG